jgi:protein SCO1
MNVSFGVRRQSAATTALLILGFSLLSVPCANAQSLTETQLSSITIDQKLGATVSKNLWFRDETGRDVQLGDYLSKKPVVLVLGYYQCPMLCNATLNGMIQGMEDMRWSIGQDFEVIHVSIDPTEKPTLAAAKKATYLKRYGRKNAAAGWHFLTGDPADITKLAEQTGFRYSYDPTVKQYAHASGLIILTPDGVISKYMMGVEFPSNELYDALKAATKREVGSRIQEFFLLCFSHNPTKGKYGNTVMVGVRTLGVITLVALAWLMISLARRETKLSEPGHQASSPPDTKPAQETPSGVNAARSEEVT